MLVIIQRYFFLLVVWQETLMLDIIGTWQAITTDLVRQGKFYNAHTVDKRVASDAT